MNRRGSFTNGITVPAVSAAALLILFILYDLPYRQGYDDDEYGDDDIVDSVHIKFLSVNACHSEEQRCFAPAMKNPVVLDPEYHIRGKCGNPGHGQLPDHNEYGVFSAKFTPDRSDSRDTGGVEQGEHQHGGCGSGGHK